MKTMSKYLKPLDLPVIILASALTLVIGVMVYSGDTIASRVIIRGPEKTWVYPLNAEERVIVSGSMGETVIEINKNRAAIVSSPCSGQTCIGAGALRKNGQWAACLPNRVFLLIEGAEGEDGVDATSW